MRAWGAGLAAGLALVAACAPRPTLTPAPTAQPAPGQPGGVMDVVSGVAFSAWPERWSATPRNLEEHVTPVLVRLENDGDVPIVVRFQHFELVNPAGGDFAAIPPFELDETIQEPVTVRYPLNGFRVAPHLRAYYPGLRPWISPFDVDRAFWSRHATAWREVALPTADMVQMALPEGVLEPGGVVTGYVYFERLTRDPAEVNLEYRVVTTDGRDLGRASLPFVVRR